MPSVNYMNDDTVRKYYRKWELSPTSHSMDREDFYKFVKACLMVDKRLDLDYLKLALYDSFNEKYDEKYYDEFTHNTVVLFEHLRDFANTTLP